ncbi:DUF2092 domain-containing protein [Paenibacillus urinalis]|uniref:DUF2092 domain-containing protein n=1 Tax=Paenibacillus urinalis TaxID=521520 RepID=A0ABY7X3X0_9BACL|nr:DUF2092 domain-containing protein [Paenibacillus urinalis]WDH96900.1 DUF2092 domain-containing protein [Paenibacillus urinalis]WDI00544.1 DUF2092 domain-containing protein [Paenibacillus urinalis]
MRQIKYATMSTRKGNQVMGILGSVLLTGMLLTGCQSGEALAYTGEEMVEKAIQVSNKPVSYYAEGEMTLFEGEKKTESMTIKEWYNADNGNNRNEIVTPDTGKSISVNDGQQVTVYEEGGNTAYTMESLENEAMQSSPKDKVLSQLERMRSTHAIETVGKEKWLDQDVYHIKATPSDKDANSLIGSQEYWVNAKDWMVVKSKVTSGDITTEFAYTLLDKSPKFTPDTFKLNIPEDAEIIALDNMGPQTITIEEAREAIGQSFLQMPAEGFDQVFVEMYEASGELDRNEVSINYLVDGKTPLSLSIFKSPGDDVQDGEFGEKVTVRGQKGDYMKEINIISWDEEGLRYSLMADQQGAQTEIDQLLEWAELLTEERE